jgi:hypothetical protein
MSISFGSEGGEDSKGSTGGGGDASSGRIGSITSSVIVFSLLEFSWLVSFSLQQEILQKIPKDQNNVHYGKKIF